VVLLATAAPAVARPVVIYDAPVPGQVLRDFEAPPDRYAAGHPGVDLAVAPGEPVRAAGGGEVDFVGSVDLDAWVTVRHADGIRTSYGSLTDLAVVIGDQVAAGQVLGAADGRHGQGRDRAEPGLHWSARRGGEYVDPMSLLDRALPRPTLVGPGGWEGSDPVVESYVDSPGGSHWLLFAPPSPEATRPGYALAPNHHHAVFVPGFATAGPHFVMRPEFLGYDDQDASAFSYAGCDPTPAGCSPRPYDGNDTHIDIDVAARLLRDHLRAQQDAQPYRPVDLIGHSMGGDVAAYYLENLHDPMDPSLPPIGNLVTLATPHQGSDSAALGRALGDNIITAGPAELLLEGLAAVGVDGADRLSLDAPALDRYGGLLGRGRPERDLARLEDLGVEALYVAGSRDGVVDPERAAPEGATAHITTGGHSSMTGKESSYQMVQDFLAGEEVVSADGLFVGGGSRTIGDLAGSAAVLTDVVTWLRPIGRVGRGLQGSQDTLSSTRDLDHLPDPVTEDSPYAERHPPSR
jgi:hypothetical protein